MKEQTKTHWLQNPNKNYLRHWDLPNGSDVLLTIDSAQWEEVKNPLINVSEVKRVIRFKEDVKPFICNETNAQIICNVTGEKYMEDAYGMKVQLFQSQVKVKGDYVDCLRVRNISSNKLSVITAEELQIILELIEQTNKDTKEYCAILKIEKLADLPSSRFDMMRKKLTKTIKESEVNSEDN